MPTRTLPLLMFACLLVGPPLVMADELPKDTNAIKSLTAEQAQRLASTFPGVSVSWSQGSASAGLPLQGLERLDAATARALRGYTKGPILLDGLTSLDVDTAKELAKSKGYLCLDGLPTIDIETAKALAEFRGECLFLNGLSTLDADTLQVLAEFGCQMLYLKGLPSLDIDTARVLAGHAGHLILNDSVLKECTATHPFSKDTALMHAELHNGNLGSLTTLDAETAEALAKFKGGLYLNGLTSFEAGAAKVLAAYPRWNGDLPAVTAFESPDSVAAARALAARTGSLRLPNLKPISPKTLTALIEKRDVELPLIETLEFIQEPDGSVTEDFEIPKWLEERHKRQAAQQGR